MWPFLLLLLLCPPRKSGGIFDFAIYFSTNAISITRNDRALVGGKIHNSDTKHKSVVLTFTEYGCGEFLDVAENTRFIVDLLDLCFDEWGVESGHVCIPKNTRNTKLLAKFLGDFCDFTFSHCREHDAYEWMCLTGELG